MSLRCVLVCASAASSVAVRGPQRPCSSSAACSRAQQHRRRPLLAAAGRQPGGAGKAEQFLSPQEALLAALRESGTPLEQIQLGRAEDDDETFLDVLDAEQDEWMRSPPPPPEFMDSLFASDAAGAAARQPQQLEQGDVVQQQEQQQQQQQRQAAE